MAADACSVSDVTQRLPPDEGQETAEVVLDDVERAGFGQSRAPYVMVIQGPGLGLVYKLTTDRIQIGRSHDAQVIIDDPGVSRAHASIERRAEGVEIVDLDSLNGVFVNGHRIERQRLRNGDRVRLGSTTVLKFSIQDEFEESFQRRLYETSVRDGLTGAYNKRFFHEQLITEFAYATRREIPLSLLMVDLDRFKRVNDSYGHPMGDYVLREVVRLIRHQLRTEDVLARYGGEEFTILLRQTDHEQARVVAERLRELIAHHIFGHERAPFSVTLSIGVATYDGRNYPQPEVLLSTADERLYAAKHAGRNAVASDETQA